MAWQGEGKLALWAPPSSCVSSSCSPGPPQQGVLEMAALHPTVSELSSWLGERLGLLWGVLLTWGVLRKHCVELVGEVCG